MAKPVRIDHDHLPAADMERLRTAVGGRSVDVQRSLLGPGTVTWRVNREVAILGGGGCALLLQVAHPLVAAGVARYSNFKADPLTRLYRTLDLMLTITFSDAASAIRAVREIERRHARVSGRLDADIGPFPRGTPYNANDPQLLLWVHATLVDTALRTYEIFVDQLSAAERETYYEESKVVGRLLGIPDAVLPRSLSAFQSYMKKMVGSDWLTVSAAGRDIALSILEPQRPLGLKYVLAPVNLLTIGLLPAPLRARYGFAWGAAREVLMRALVTMTQLTIPLLPETVRFFPHARRAAVREALRRPREDVRRAAGRKRAAAKAAHA